MKFKRLRGTGDQKIIWMFTITLLIFATQQTFFSDALSGVVASVIWFLILAACILYLFVIRKFVMMSILSIVLFAGAIHTSMKLL